MTSYDYIFTRLLDGISIQLWESSYDVHNQANQIKYRCAFIRIRDGSDLIWFDVGSCISGPNIFVLDSGSGSKIKVKLGWVILNKSRKTPMSYASKPAQVACSFPPCTVYPREFLSGGEDSCMHVSHTSKSAVSHSINAVYMERVYREWSRAKLGLTQIIQPPITACYARSSGYKDTISDPTHL